MRFSLRSCVLVATWGCSLQELPELGARSDTSASAASSSGSGGATCGEAEPVDLQSSTDHCGACDHACIAGQPCIEGACRVASSPDTGAWALALEPGMYVVWSRLKLGSAIQRTSLLDGATIQKHPLLVWELETVNGVVGVVPVAGIGANSGTLPFAWFSWDSDTLHVQECSGCLAYDLAAGDPFLVWATDQDVFFGTDPPAPVGLSRTVAMIAYSRVGRVALGEVVPGEEGVSDIRVAESLEALGAGQLSDVVGRVVRLPSSLEFLGETLFWIEYGAVRCLPKADPAATYFAGVGANPTTLHPMWDDATPDQGKLVVALDDGRILRGDATCAPQSTLELLEAPPPSAQLIIPTMTSSPGAASDLYFTRASRIASENSRYGGVFVRSGATPSRSTLTVP